jgi:vacuolar-type H+-ATPase subunit I/STV1
MDPLEILDRVVFTSLCIGFLYYVAQYIRHDLPKGQWGISDVWAFIVVALALFAFVYTVLSRIMSLSF